MCIGFLKSWVGWMVDSKGSKKLRKSWFYDHFYFLLVLLCISFIFIFFVPYLGGNNNVMISIFWLFVNSASMDMTFVTIF